LVIEVDVSRSSLNKLAIYAGLGVHEVWRYRATGITILRLAGGAYSQVEASEILPGITGEQLMHLLEASEQMKRKDWLQEIRAVAQPLTN
jgi:Uma2 family endonuclease